MKILQLSPQFPYPLSDGGKISIANMTRALTSQGCEVHVFCLVKVMPTEADIHAFETYSGATCTCIMHDTSNSLLAMFSSLFDGVSPLYIRKHRSKELRIAIERLIQTEKIDAILCDHTALSETGIHASRIGHIPCIIRMHNIEHVIWERYAERRSFFDPRKWFIQSQAKKLKKKEITLCNEAQHNAMITKYDVEKIQSFNSAITASYVPVGIDTTFFKPDESSIPKSNRIIHATTYDWIHNVEALDWFIKEVLPAVHTSHDAELVLLGKHMPERYLLGESQGLIGKGFVEDINHEFNKASIYIAPLFVGGGIRIKILEAMSSGLPVIASPISAEGIEAKREDGLILCTSSEEWIREISDLIEHPDKAQMLGGNARHYIETHHSWEFSAKYMIDIMKNHQIRT
jgi:glycosyltransferase involved in cell wall biosynthesis